MISHGFKQCASDHSLFLKHGYKTITALLVYVDDIVLSGNDLAEIQSITQLLDNAFKIKDLGDPRYFLGFEAARKSIGINLRSKPISTPSNYTTKLHQHSGTLISMEDASFFRRLIGKLIYLTNTRPYITYVVQFLSQFVTTPTSAH